MSLTEREDTTRKLYNANAEEWLAKSGGRERPCFWAEEMDRFTDYLGTDRDVLEVGCGPATDGKYLAMSGERVLSTDYSETMLSIARELNPEGDYLLMDMNSLNFNPESFDGFWASACLLHLEDPGNALEGLHRITKKGGGRIYFHKRRGRIRNSRKNWVLFSLLSRP